jgi:hypothetical protein
MQLIELYYGNLGDSILPVPERFEVTQYRFAALNPTDC